MPTTTLTGVAVAPLIPAPVGAAVAVITTAPLVEGFHEHVAVMLGEDPEVNLFLHPEIMMFFALNVTRDVTLTPSKHHVLCNGGLIRRSGTRKFYTNLMERFVLL